MYKNAKKKMHQLMTHLTLYSRGALEGTFDGTPKHALRDLHKDAQKSACEVALWGALEVALELHMCLAQMRTKWFI